MNDSKRPDNDLDSTDFDENDVIVVEEDWDDDEWETGGDDGLPAPSWSGGAESGATDSAGSGEPRDTDGVRLQKVMASSGVASRRASEELIEAGRVRVNGEVVRELGRRINPELDKIAVDNVAVQLDTSRRYVMLNKPVGVVSSLSDENGRPDLRQFTNLFEERLFNVGRLDAETSGLLILTNDGELAHILAHPSFGVMKTYIAKVRGKVTAHTISKLTGGIDLEDGHIAADKARLMESANNSMYSLVEITLHSGRNRIVRRMLDAVGHPVVDLVRRSFGPLMLGSLTVGGVRELTRDELGALLTLSRADSGLSKPTRAPRAKKSDVDGQTAAGKNVPGKPKAFKANGKPAGKGLGKDAGKPRWATATRGDEATADHAGTDNAQLSASADVRELSSEDAEIAAAAAARRAARPVTSDRKAPTKYAGKPAKARTGKDGAGSERAGSERAGSERAGSERAGSARAGSAGGGAARAERPARSDRPARSSDGERGERGERGGYDRDRSTGAARSAGYESRGGASGGYNRTGGSDRDGGRSGGYESRGGSSGGYNRTGGSDRDGGRSGGYESRGGSSDRGAGRGGYESRGGSSGGYNRTGGSDRDGGRSGGYESRGGSSGGYNRTGGSDRDGGRDGRDGGYGARGAASGGSQGRGGYQGGGSQGRGGYQGRDGDQGRGGYSGGRGDQRGGAPERGQQNRGEQNRGQSGRGDNAGGYNSGGYKSGRDAGRGGNAGGGNAGGGYSGGYGNSGGQGNSKNSEGRRGRTDGWHGSSGQGGSHGSSGRNGR